jgi:hypothetical protein
MNIRKYALSLMIDTGRVRCRYSVRPVPAADLAAPFLVGVRIVNQSKSPSPAYLVGLTAEGKGRCTCPSFSERSPCKHVEALTTAGLLPVRFIQLLAERTAQLNRAEASALAEREALAADAAQERAVAEHDLAQLRDRVRELEADLAAALAPKRRSRKHAA